MSIRSSDCDASYVRQTGRQLDTRMKKHRANVKLDPSKHSVVSNHILEFNHSFDWNNIKTFDTEYNFYKRLTSEIIHIKEQKNGINFQRNSELLNDIHIFRNIVGACWAMLIYSSYYVILICIYFSLRYIL